MRYPKTRQEADGEIVVRVVPAHERPQNGYATHHFKTGRERHDWRYHNGSLDDLHKQCSQLREIMASTHGDLMNCAGDLLAAQNYRQPGITDDQLIRIMAAIMRHFSITATAPATCSASSTHA